MISFLSFDEAISYIKSLDVYGSVLGLSNMEALCKELDNPQDSLRFVHVTGTNGKGSVCAFLSSILCEAGYMVGAYDSPAVLSDIDQFSINRETISEELYAQAVTYVKKACDSITGRGGVQPTRFEVETMVAFVAFKLADCDIVILETGLGGRDDATNIVKNTLVHAFTSISLDHSIVLGDTLSEIASVKSGIIKSDAPTVMYVRGGGLEDELSGEDSVGGFERKTDHSSDEGADSELNSGAAGDFETNSGVIGDSERNSSVSYNEEKNSSVSSDAERAEILKACEVISDRCRQMGSPLTIVSSDSVANVFVKKDKLHFDMPEFGLCDLKLKMLGAYQPYNAAIAVKVIRELLDKGYVVTRQNIEKGLKKAYIPFRFEVVKRKVDIILDGAHNPDGAKKLMDSLKLVYPDREYIYVTGIFRDKDYEKIASITGPFASKIFVIRNSDTGRSLESGTLSEVFLKYNENVDNIENIELALKQAIKCAAGNETSVIVCFGSLSWLKYVKKYLSI